MTNLLVGTTSWTEKTLLDSKRFYPSNATTSAARLRYYATQFRIVEVDSSYYGLPAERNSLLWAERTPEGFVFDVKAFRLFTQHQTPLPVLPKDIVEALGDTKGTNLYYADLPNEAREELWRRFRLSLEPLRKAGKLGVVLFQFPPWFVYKPSGLEYIAHCAEMLTGDQVAVEFRHRSWLNEKHADEVLAFEREHNLAHVVVDEPQGFVSSVPAVWDVTCQSVAVVRLHGRNRQTWAKKGLARPPNGSGTCTRKTNSRILPRQSKAWRNKHVWYMCSSTTATVTMRSGMHSICGNSSSDGHGSSHERARYYRSSLAPTQLLLGCPPVSAIESESQLCIWR